MKKIKKYKTAEFLKENSIFKETCIINNVNDALSAIEIAFEFISSKKRIDVIDIGAEAIAKGVKNYTQDKNLIKKILKHLKDEIYYILNKELMNMPESKQKYKIIKETSYNVTNISDAKDTISDLSNFIIAKYPEPKSLWIITTSILDSLRTMFPDENNYKQVKHKVAQAILNLD
jgi:hypothetical protein